MNIPQITLDRFAKLTNENCHTEALIVLCDAIISCAENAKEEAQKQRNALVAIEVLHKYKGHLVPGLFLFREEIAKVVYHLLQLSFECQDTLTPPEKY